MLIKRFFSPGKLYSRCNSTRFINNELYETDSLTNVTEKIISCTNRKLFNEKEHPLCLLKERIIHFFYQRFLNNRGNPIFSVYDNLSPVVSPYQNFDSLLVPEYHPSRSKTDCYYINKNFMLRSHMTAHQSDLIKMGLNNFLMVGDVYRRDSIDSTHYPVFHQIDAVRLLTADELFSEKDNGKVNLKIFDEGDSLRTKEKQETHSLKATKLVEKDLKLTLETLSYDLFGPKIEFRWVEANFPFTHPSWELEILLNGKWVEILGCGIIECNILNQAGCKSRIGWALGLGLERLAMLYYSIPDIRIFWSTDPGFLCQFKGKKFTDKVTFKSVSKYPSSEFNISFWINEFFYENDFYEIARNVCGDVIEQIYLIDSYTCPKTGRKSNCFKVVYRSMFKTFTKEELKKIHKKLEETAERELDVTIR